MNRFMVSMVATVALAMVVAPVQAEWTVGADVNFFADYNTMLSGNFGGNVVPIGSFNAVNHQGTLGHVYGPVDPWDAYHGFFGAQWAGPVEVYSLSMNQLVDSGRSCPDTVYLYTNTDPTKYVEIRLPNQQGAWDQPIDLRPFNGGQPIYAENSYLLLAVQTMHPGGNDANFGVMSYGFDAKAVGPADVNVNLDAVEVKLTGALWNSPERTNDNKIATWGSDTMMFWTRDASGVVTNELIVTYDGPRTIGSIGLAFEGDADSGRRDCPLWVEIVPDGDLSRKQRIELEPGMLAYGRYELPDGPLVGVTELTLLMPRGDDLSAWIVRNDRNFGITEFQAFAAVPEPATMTLLTIGGLALRRRK